MRTTIEVMLETAGFGRERPVEVLRDGFPSYVMRVSKTTLSESPTVIVKACPFSSREPDILLCLHRAGLAVPRVLDVREGEDFRVVIMEDVGIDALHKRRDPAWYMRVTWEIAEIHRQFDLGSAEPGNGVAGRKPAALGVASDLVALLPRYDTDKWRGIVREAKDGTIQRLRDGTYLGLTLGEIDELVYLLERLANDTLRVLWEMQVREGSSERKEPGTGFGTPTFIHGDLHDGNVLIRSGSDYAASPFVIVDWASARLDSGFFDLVSLYDVAERMKTCRLDPEIMIATYLDARWPDGVRNDVVAAKKEWSKCRMLRAWDELRWFATTGDDFGDRARREVSIIGEMLCEL